MRDVTPVLRKLGLRQEWYQVLMKPGRSDGLGHVQVHFIAQMRCPCGLKEELHIDVYAPPEEPRYYSTFADITARLDTIAREHIAEYYAKQPV